MKKLSKRVGLAALGIASILGKGYAVKKGVDPMIIDYGLMTLFGGVMGTKAYDVYKYGR